jgi:transketolase
MAGSGQIGAARVQWRGGLALFAAATVASGLVGDGGRSVAIDTFGLPGDGQLVLNHFGFTPENIAAEAKATLPT